jgi:copper chaperone CopZ
MTKETFSIPNISCGHCTTAIQNELTDLEGVTCVDGQTEAKTVTVEWDAPVTRDQILDVLKEINYPAKV